MLKPALVGRLMGALLALVTQSSLAGAQVYEPLTEEVRSVLSGEIANSEPPRVQFSDFKQRLAYLEWLGEMSERLKSRQSNFLIRKDILETVYYEAKRAGLDPAMMLGLIQVESGFHKYAVSGAGAIGMTQVMPFWANLIGDGDKRKLFDMRVNIRFGCVILRHYLDIENGNLFRALGRYNGSLGQPQYPELVLGAWKRWQFEPQLAPPALPSVRAPSA